MDDELAQVVEGSRSTLPEKLNWRIHEMYVRQDFDACLRIIEDQLRATKGQSEYALYMKALIYRHFGRIQESLHTFQAALCLNPVNVSNLKQVGYSLHLLGKHKSAIDVFEEAEQLNPDERDLHHNKAVCYMHMNSHDNAINSFETANSIQRHEATFLQLGKLYEQQNRNQDALAAYIDASELVPENAELLTTIGLLYKRMGNDTKAFEFFGNSLTYDPKNVRSLLAAASIIQENQDIDVALSKYRTAIHQCRHCAELWNNIGLCFFSKSFQSQESKIIAAISCLRRASYLSPFSWKIKYNLGIVYLTMGQFVSSLQNLSAAISLNPSHAKSYASLAIVLSKLGDFRQSCEAYDRSLDLENDCTTRCNYAITLYNNDEPERARTQLEEYTRIQNKHPSIRLDPEVIEQMIALQQALT